MNSSSVADVSSLTQIHHVLHPSRVPLLQMETTAKKGWPNVKEARSSDYGLGAQIHISRAREKGKMKMPSARTTTASIPDSCSAVGMAGIGLGVGGSVPVTLDGVRDFPPLFALPLVMEEAPNDARLVMTGFLRRPRNWHPNQGINRRCLRSTVQDEVGRKFQATSSWKYLQEEVLRVGYLEKDSNFIILYQIWSKGSRKIKNNNTPLEPSNRPSSPPRSHTGLHTSQSHPWPQTVSIVPNPPVRVPLPIVAAQVEIKLDYDEYLVKEWKFSDNLE